jgi:PhnB protein
MIDVSPIREGYHTVTPCLVVKNGNEAIEFYKRAFNLVESFRNYAPDGKRIMYAELKLGDSIIILSDEFPDMGCYSPLSIGGSAVSLYVYVLDADKVFSQALLAGAQEIVHVMDAPWGDRCGQLKDPYGHVWSVATHKIDMSPEEMEKECRKSLLKLQTSLKNQQQYE